MDTCRFTDSRAFCRPSSGGAGVRLPSSRFMLTFALVLVADVLEREVLRFRASPFRGRVSSLTLGGAAVFYNSGSGVAVVVATAVFLGSANILHVSHAVALVGTLGLDTLRCRFLAVLLCSIAPCLAFLRRSLAGLILVGFGGGTSLLEIAVCTAGSTFSELSTKSVFIRNGNLCRGWGSGITYRSQEDPHLVLAAGKSLEGLHHHAGHREP